jgi:hypothetical protein
MANNCDNRLEISGEPENLKKLYEKLKSNNTLHLENYPTIFESVEENYSWGSKWQQLDVDYYEGEDNMTIMGDSAWGPAIGLWKKVSKDYQLAIELTYSEPGGDIAGVMSWEDGELIDEKEMTYMEYLYHYDNDYFYDEVGYRSEYSPLDELIDELGDIYESLSDSEKERVRNIHEENYQEEED